MEIPTDQTSVATGGGILAGLTALLHGIWSEWKLGRKFERVNTSIKELKTEMEVRSTAVENRLRGHDEEIEAHAIFDAKNYVTRDEFSRMISNLDSKLDSKFDILNSNIITAIRDGSRRGNE